MCSVEKLLIKGIRSFSPENDHAIVFPKPLTLIVGRNGAGKTVRPRSSRFKVSGVPRSDPPRPSPPRLRRSSSA